MAILQGEVKRITYRDDQTHYTVAKLQVDKLHAPGESPLLFAGPEEVAIVGHFTSITPGEWLEVEGEWYVHGEFGKQFRVASYRKAPPATAKGIERYLASGAVPGIGPKLAERLVAKFGERTLEVIEREPERLLEVEGIGEQKLRAISQAIRGERQVREALVFLQSYGIGSGTAGKIFRHYGEKTMAVVRENPYRLAGEVFGIGFKTADEIALQMGVAKDAPMRARAALLYLLNQAGAEGHVYLPQEALLSQAAKMDIPRPAAEEALAGLAVDGELVLEPLRDDVAVYPAVMHRAEEEVARRLHEMCGRAKGGAAAGASDPGLTPEQRLAVSLACEPGGGLLVITGGPGTGKTTTLRAIVAALESQKRTYLLGAPTGRASKRLQEATGKEARTLHRLLEFAGGEGGAPRFQRNERNPLDAHVVIVDEASMIDLPLAWHLLRALPRDAKLILVGDADQLPSVGPGNVLRDLLSCPAVPSVRLTRVFRQAEASRIVVNAHRIQQGLKPLSGGEGSDFFFLPEPDAEKARALIRDLVARRLPRYLSCDPRTGVQVLSAVRRGPLGVASLNQVLQEALNPPRQGVAEVRAGAEAFRPGDRVMQVKNNYDKMVFNGDIGVVTAVDPGERVVEVLFPDRDDPSPVVYEGADVHQLTLAYCTSVHKSQGSEYPAVVMPISWVMPTLMNRNLLYTAITRAKRLVVLVGREDALWAYIRNVKAEARYTRLAERLAARFAAAGAGVWRQGG